MALGDVNHVLTNANEGGDSSITYTCVSINSGTSLYRKTGSATSNNDTISYNSTSGWADVGDGQPRFFGDAVPATSTISPGPTVLKLYLIDNSWGQICVLNTGYTSTITSGSTSPAGTVVKIGTSANAATVKFTIDASSPSSSGVISYEIVRDGVVTSTIAGHIAGTPTETTVGWYNSRWELKMVSTTGLYETQTLAFIVKEVNVSQNFW